MSSTPLATVTSKPGFAYKQEIQAGLHKVTSDVSIVYGGTDQGPTPHELFLGALGACAAMTMQMVAQRKKWDLQKVTVRLYEEQVDDPGQPGQKIPKITEEIEVEGNLSPQELTGLEAAAKKCPVLKLFTGPKLFESTLSLTPPAQAPAPAAPAQPAAPPAATPADGTSTSS